MGKRKNDKLNGYRQLERILLCVVKLANKME